jgi:hypothetical protein
LPSNHRNHALLKQPSAGVCATTVRAITASRAWPSDAEAPGGRSSRSDDPLQARLAEVKVRLDRGQGNVHDRDIEHEDELSGNDHCQVEPPPGVRLRHLCAHQRMSVGSARLRGAAINRWCDVRSCCVGTDDREQAASAVRVRVMKRVERLVSRNRERKRLNCSPVLDGHEHVIRARVPHQPDFDVIVRPEVELSDR